MSKLDMKSFREQLVNLKGGQVNEIYFIDTKPNFIYITNLGTGTMYVDDQPNVTTDSYEVLTGSLMKRSIVKPLGLQTLYVYADVDGKAKIESGVAELSISDIPMTQIVATLSNSLSVSKVDVQKIIDQLPAGTNRIGDVGIVSMPDVNVTTLPVLPAGTNRIGDVGIVSMPNVNVTTLPSNTPLKVTLVAGVDLVVKSTAGTVMKIKSNLTDLILKNGSTEVWTGADSFEGGIYLSTSIVLNSATGGTTYISFR